MAGERLLSLEVQLRRDARRPRGGQRLLGGGDPLDRHLHAQFGGGHAGALRVDEAADAILERLAPAARPGSMVSAVWSRSCSSRSMIDGSLSVMSTIGSPRFTTCPSTTCQRTMRPSSGDSMFCGRSSGLNAITRPAPGMFCCHGVTISSTTPTTA